MATTPAQAGVMIVSNPISDAFDKAWQALQQAYDKAIASMQASLAIRTQEAAAQRAGQTAVDHDNRAAEAAYRVSDACAQIAPNAAVAAGMNVNGGNGNFGRGGGKTLPQSATGVTSDMQAANEIADGVRPAPQPETTAQLRSSGLCGSYAGGVGRRSKECQSAYGVNTASTGFPEADINAATIILGPQTNLDSAKWVRHRTLTDSKQVGAVKAFIHNVTQPFELRDLSKGELNTDAGRQYVGAARSFDAIMSASSLGLTSQLLGMTPNASFIPMLKTLRQSPLVGKYVTDYTNAIPNWDKTGISQNEMLRLEAERRYFSTEWREKLVSMEPPEIAKEHLEMAALHAWQMDELTDVMRNIAVMLSVNGTLAARQTLLPQLATMHGAATNTR